MLSSSSSISKLSSSESDSYSSSCGGLSSAALTQMDQSSKNVSWVACLGTKCFGFPLELHFHRQTVDLSAYTAGGSAPALSFVNVAWLQTVKTNKQCFAFFNCLSFICQFCLIGPNYFLLYKVNCQKIKIKKHLLEICQFSVNLIQILSRKIFFYPPKNCSFILARDY